MRPPVRKPADLRAYLTRANPFLARDPGNLHVFVDQGNIVSTGTPSLAHEYRYVLHLIVQDYAGTSDAIMLPLLSWLRRNQPELMENPELRGNALQFEVDYITHDTIDLSIKLPLTERVITRVDPATGRLDAVHVGEPPHPDLPPEGTLLDVYLDGSRIASVDSPAAPATL
jgi:hypothetical protein